MGLIIICITVGVILIVLFIGTHMKEDSTGQQNVVTSFSKEEVLVINEGSYKEAKQLLDLKCNEVNDHITGDISSDVKRQIQIGFIKQVHNAENNVVDKRYHQTMAENNLEISFEEIGEYHNQVGELKVIKKRHYQYKLVSRIIEDSRGTPLRFFMIPVRNHVDNYSTGYDLWRNLAFRKVKKKKFLEKAIKIEAKAEKALDEFSEARKARNKAEEELEKFKALQKKYEDYWFKILP